MLRTGLFLPAGFQVMSFAPLAAFEIANQFLDEPAYEVQVPSEHGGRPPNSFGMVVETTKLADAHCDTLLVGAAMEVGAPSRDICAALQSAAARSRRTASICSRSRTACIALSRMRRSISIRR